MPRVPSLAAVLFGLLLQVVLSGLALGAAAAGCAADEKAAIPNVRLGMAPRDVRDRFQPGGSTDPGSWQTALGAGDDTVLEWTARDPKATIAQARFEFHLGMLVAIRARTTEGRAGQSVTSTARTVTELAPSPDGGTSVIVLARDCPTHREEAERLASKAH